MGRLPRQTRLAIAPAEAPEMRIIAIGPPKAVEKAAIVSSCVGGHGCDAVPLTSVTPASPFEHRSSVEEGEADQADQDCRQYTAASGYVMARSASVGAIDAF